MIAVFEHPQDCNSLDSKRGFGEEKVCAHFVPHSSTPQQREDQVTSSQDIIAMANTDKKLFNKIIMGDETWCFAYDPETKRLSSEWVSETSKGPTSRPC
jgi:hypothetical protein